MPMTASRSSSPRTSPAVSTTTREDVRRQVGEGGGGGLDVVDAGEVAGGDPQELAALPASPGRRGPAGGSVRGASGAQHRQRLGVRGEHARQAAARRQHGDQRLGHRLELDRAGGEGGRGRPAPAPGSAERSASSSITGGAAPAAPRARRRRWPASSSPCDRADAPISTAPTRHHSTSASRSTSITSVDDLESGRERGGGVDGLAADLVASRAAGRRRRGRRPSASGRWRARARARPPARWSG